MVGGSPIYAYESTPIVFIGTVTSIKEEKVIVERFGDEVEMRTGLTAYFDVDDPLKGISQKEATILTGGGGGDCGYPFKVGEKYLVFATLLNHDSGRNVVARTVFGNPNKYERKIVGLGLSTNICTFTNNLKNNQDELEIIRAFRSGKPETRIYGRVAEYVYDFDGGVMSKYVGPMSGIEVVAVGQRGKFEAKTDETGKFSIRNLPVGKYTLKFLLPSTHTVHWSWDKLIIPVELKSKEDSEEIDLDTQVNTSVGGQVRDWKGNPGPEQIQLSMIPVEFADKPNPGKHCRSEYTDKRGRYRFDGVKPGKYVLGVSIADSPAKHTPFSKVYLPSGTDVSVAQIIEVKIGQSLNNLNLTLSKELEKYVVEGLVVSADGKPVSGASVNIYDAETPDETVFGFSSDVKTDIKGRFKITGFSGRRYLLRAYKDEDYFAGKGFQSQRIEVLFSDTAKDVKLVLDKKGIFLNQLK
ncbi:MAG: carboxypeptidase-like regulatory domain-containing protein [Pyrinomonadaceae bacterium]